ncbi:MAG: LLM class F420-dependent oxidoreductase [Chloroflexi bacterium]|nr:MAG: LLM class F420-dependent oxidoreductase [Chloroflexota bacterium]
MRPLKVGVILPHLEGWMTGETARWSDLLELARVAEDVGFDSLWLADHMLYRLDGIEPFGVWECWSLLSALAASTSRVELGTIVTCTSFRNPALLAKMADTVDEISGGRLILGLGAGSHEAEYHAFGWPWDHRVSRFEEALQIIHALLRTGAVDFDGTYYTARECELRPRGPRHSGPPIMVGTLGERMLRLTARYADEWNMPWRNTVQAAVDLFPKGDAACIAVDRDPATLKKSVSIHLDLPSRNRYPSKDWITQMRIAVNAVTGTPEEQAEVLRAYATAGVSTVQLWLEPMNPHGLEEFGRVLELLDGP